MKRHLFLALASTSLLLMACEKTEKAAEAAPPAEPAAAQPAQEPSSQPEQLNVLTAAEQAAGWKLLFNGKDFTGWRVYKKQDVPAQWKVEDNAIALTQGGGGDLMTAEEYGPFELSLEWKISPAGNSGIIYLIKEDAKAPNTYNSGPEMQVLDDAGHADGKIPSHRAGALYDFAPPLATAAHPVGEWNHALVRFTGTKIKHFLNGQLVAESSYADDAWKAKVAASKFKDMPLFGKAATGHIALQDHGDKVWYRNIKIKPL